MRFITIVALAVLAGITYGILHDQVTAHVCVEYFTIGHPPLIPTESPTLLAIAWGIVATWWFALPLGVALASAARVGERPKLTASQLVRPLLTLLAAMGALALVAGVTGYVLTSTARIPANEWVVANIVAGKRAAFMADWWAHSASYIAGFVGALILCLHTWWLRSRVPREAAPLKM